MALRVDVRSNLRLIAQQFATATRRQVEAATVRALNRAATTVRATTSREIRAVYNLSASAVKQQITLRPANRARLVATVIASGERIPLSEFLAGSRVAVGGVTFIARTRRGGRSAGSLRVASRRARRFGELRVRIKKAGGVKTIPHAFVAVMESGHVGVFARVSATKPKQIFRHGPGSGAANRGWGQPDLPISELHSLSLPVAFVNKQIQAKLQRLARERFQVEFTRELRFRTTRR